jgi:CRP/FNR family transcriptional regulator, polysaccharide utilization system transcription regulator
MQYKNPYIELCLEGESSIFKGLNHKEKETVAQHHFISVAKKGEFLFKDGDKCRGLICLVSGKAKVFKVGVGGREQILRMVKQQGFIGYRSLFNETIWSFSAEAIEETIICTFDKTALLKVLKKNNDLSMKFLKLVTEELCISDNRTISLTQKHVRGRLAESLLLLLDTYGYEQDSKIIGISMSREDIAHLSNMTTSNAIRTLSNLAAEGIISLKGRKITILNRTALEHISEQG